MYILGISSNVHISSACILKDGNIVAAIAEERLNREKHSRKFPEKAIKQCLNIAKIGFEEINYIAIANDIIESMKNKSMQNYEVLRNYNELLLQIPFKLQTLFKLENVDSPSLTMSTSSGEHKIYFIGHHKCHLANGYYLSGKENATLLTIDGMGEDGTTVFATGNKNKISVNASISYPNSIGIFYSTITEFLGYKHDSDEWKVMGMAACASGNNKYYPLLKKLVRYDEKGYTLDLAYFSFFNQYDCKMYSGKLIEILGKDRKPYEPIEQKHYEIAAAAQKVYEELVFHLINLAKRESNIDQFCLSGGSFMNSTFNGKIINENFFVSSCPDDSGISIGAALYLYYNILDNDYVPKIQSEYAFGPEYSNEYIKSVLVQFGVKYKKSDDICKYAAEKIAKGKIIGWFQGKMEFGQRALGNRSILADARNKEIKNEINQKIKFRENYRPFAPSVLIEDFEQYFYGDKRKCFYMSCSIKANAYCKKHLPAIVHDNHTSRVQTVDKNNVLFYRLHKEYKRITGQSVLLNTSFNVNGEPIVCSPEDAIKTFFSCGLDILILGDYLIEK